MKRKILNSLAFWLLFFWPRSLTAQDLDAHFQKIRDGIYVYSIDDLAGPRSDV